METLEPELAARPGTPSIALDDDCRPAVLHARDGHEDRGFFARRTDEGWSHDSTTFDLTEGGLRFDERRGVFRALVHDGSFSDPAPRTSTTTPGAEGLVLDYGAWLSTAVPRGTEADSDVTVTLAADGTRHLTWWSSEGLQPTLRWESSDGRAEELAAFGPGRPGSVAHALAVTETGGQTVPHVLTGTATALDGRMRVVYLRRDALGWSRFVVASEDPTGESTCEHEPQSVGETCSLDRITHRPLAIAAARSGEVRWLFTEVHEQVDYVAECGETCEWVAALDMSTFGTYLGWLEDDVPQAVEVLPGTHLSQARLVVDRGGAMHVVAYAHDVADARDDGSTVEYYRLDR